MKHIVALITLLMLVSCDDYLDVKPEDKLLEEQVFESEASILNALNGIYTNMTKNSTYGGNLTMTAVEALGQRYKVANTSHDWNLIANYDYESSRAISVFNAIWADQYVNILNINNFIAGIEANPGTLDPDKESMVLGEAYGLRAMLHFDLLRLFGPVYTVNPDKESIPYYDNNSGDTEPLLPATEVMARVLSDLEKAETFLANDIIIEYGPLDIGLGVIIDDLSKYYLSRQYRFNYYAAKALQARVHLYAGNTTEAYNAATFVIENASEWFPWTDEADIFTEAANPDRSFSNEIVFGLINTAMYDRHRSYFAPSVVDNKILTADEFNLEQVFEFNTLDYRYNSTWQQPGSGAKPYKTFLKYADVNDNRTTFRFKQSLIRLTEMYYIAAETETDSVKALQYINTVRNNRGLQSLTTADNIQNEILKEYRKEFYGEGQLFFYYKRLNVQSIPSGTSGVSPYQMGADQYVVPLPTSETEYRN
ncbi:RagB/SusD family nutrient uptake outer membrane protein [Aestuariibaculum lutulentum]|uniref:RagB/SusD family nutrient uptake outer membrane protein n=1 Tax=Aestuariibaculum lutulentum TaxID=2920935 RepID=A0ABS9RJB9_9FLAO|nr:RagB/SusD family nutrient uptake outer membrane protein [Aestuariibaculum lutulentum]MCH4553056.1 RagB/SusD family nutrient uptake outer membrane protein [Aestuariibaculum lutulentum]